MTPISNLVIYLHRSQIWEISISWDVVWNAHDQSDCRILKSTIYIERNHEIAWVSKFQLATWINQIHENWKMIQSFFERVWSKMVVTTLVMGSCHKTLKLAVSQEEVNRIVWFSSCSYKIRKAKSLTTLCWCEWSKMDVATWIILFKTWFYHRMNRWIELIDACWQWCNNFCLNCWSHSELWLLNKGGHCKCTCLDHVFNIDIWYLS